MNSNPFVSLQDIQEGHDSMQHIEGIPLMARICSWNIRGLNWPDKQEDIKLFLHEKNTGFVGLFETKVKERNVEKVAHNIFHGWKWHHNFNLNAKGRICVAWKPSLYNVQILSTGEQFIHCQVTMMQDMRKFFLTYVCGANHEGQKRVLWEALEDFAAGIADGWRF